MVKKIARKKTSKDLKEFRVSVRGDGLEERFTEQFESDKEAFAKVEERYVAKGHDKDIFNIMIREIKK